MPRPAKPRNICPCGRECRPRAKRCDWCRDADTSGRHHNRRTEALSQMVFSFDGEGAEDSDGIMRYVTMSVGREDGTSESVYGVTVRQMLHWAIDLVNREQDDEGRKYYTSPTDGKKYSPVSTAFHFGWDTSTILKEFKAEDMFLIRRAQAKRVTALCWSEHRDGEKCPMLIDLWENPCTPDGKLRVGASFNDENLLVINLRHRTNPEDIDWVLGEGGDGDLLAFEPSSLLALTSTPGRRFYAEYRPHGDRMEEWKRLDIHDTGRSFIGGLEKVIEQWRPELSPEQRAIIARGKANRGKPGFEDDLAKLAEYSEAECVAHARIVRKLLDSIRDAAHVNIAPSKLFGSGSIAASVMKHYKVPTRKQTHRDEDVFTGVGIEDMPDLTYFGGMIETPVVGLVKGTVDEEDINQAYPSVLVELECMRKDHGRWVKKHGSWTGYDQLPRYTIGYALVSWSILDQTSSTPPFVVRGQNGCVYQTWTQTQKVWVTLPEYRTALTRYPTDIKCHQIVIWEATEDCDCDAPFWWLQSMYNYRFELKKRIKARRKDIPAWEILDAQLEALEPDDPTAALLSKQMKDILMDDPECLELFCQEQAIKLIINSVYGKLAEYKRGLGRYTNRHYAAMITGATRAKVRTKTWEREAAGGTVVYQHTDSVLSINGGARDEGDELGKWGLEDKVTRDFLILQPGLAVALGGGKTASRGCSEEKLVEAARLWESKVDLTQHPLVWPEIVVTQQRMISRKLAQVRGRPELAGNFVPHPLRIKPSREKRDLANAVPLEGCPTAWKVPARQTVHDLMTLGQIKATRTSRQLAIRLGEEDDQED